jgi:hypothetical protein
VGIVRMLFQAELRQRWRSWVLLGLLVALGTGLVLAGVVAGRRTATGFPRFAAAHGFDVIAYSVTPLPKIAQLPDVTSVITTQTLASGQPQCDCTHAINENGFSVYAVGPRDLRRMVKLVAGRMPNPSDPH